MSSRREDGCAREESERYSRSCSRSSLGRLASSNALSRRESGLASPRLVTRNALDPRRSRLRLRLRLRVGRYVIARETLHGDADRNCHEAHPCGRGAVPGECAGGIQLVFIDSRVAEAAASQRAPASIATDSGKSSATARRAQPTGWLPSFHELDGFGAPRPTYTPARPAFPPSRRAATLEPS